MSKDMNGRGRLPRPGGSHRSLLRFIPGFVVTMGSGDMNRPQNLVPSEKIKRNRFLPHGKVDFGFMSFVSRQCQSRCNKLEVIPPS